MCTRLGINLKRFSSLSDTILRRCSNSASTNVVLDIDDSGFATISMNKGPVNSLNLEMIQDLSKAFNTALSSNCKGVILTSGLRTIFSGGLDIMEMYQPKQERLVEFWSSLQDLGLLLTGLKLPVIAVINGHSPAGGCYLSLGTDYRIMLPNFTIGLNETKLGIVAPFWFREPMVNTIGYRRAELALALGTLFSTEQALNIGLIDQIADDKAIAIEQAKKKLGEFSRIPGPAFQITKQEMRRPITEKLQKTREQDLKQFVSFCFSPEVQKGLEKYMETLRKKK